MLLHLLYANGIWMLCVCSPTFAPENEAIERERCPFPFAFYNPQRMDKSGQIALLEKMVNSLLESDPSFFLVQVKIKPTNNIKVFIDGDHGVTIENCIKLNRKLYSQLEEAAVYPDGDYSLEVSSPGVGEPLLLHRQYLKNAGRLLEVKLMDDTTIIGVLKIVAEDHIVLEATSGKGKKAVTQQHQVFFTQIKEASVQIQF